MEVRPLLKKNGVKSSVWKYFSVRTPSEKDYASCNLCSRKIPTKGGTTACLLSHLRCHHIHEFESVKGNNKAKTQLNIRTCIEKSGQYEKSSFRWQSITEDITRCLAKDVMPIYSVQKEGFRNMLETLDKRYRLPSRNYFTSTAIPALYEKTRTNVKRYVMEAAHVSLTTDLWTSCNGLPYISLSAHYINENWEMDSYCLETHFIQEDHTGLNIADTLKCMLQSWEIEKKNIVAVTTDNGTNVISACSLSELTRISCFGHNLNLAITNSLKDFRVTRAIAVAKRLVASFSHSFKKKRDLGIAQERFKLPSHMLVVNCPTRWGSLFRMIERILEQQEAIRDVLSKERKDASLLPSWQDFDVYQSISNALKPLSNLTDALSGDKHVTISALRPMQEFIKEEMSPKDEDTNLTKVIKGKIRDYINKKMSELPFEIIEKSTFLDPRFLNYVRNMPSTKSSILVELKKNNNSLDIPLRNTCAQNEEYKGPISLGKLIKSKRFSPYANSKSGEGSRNSSEGEILAEVEKYASMMPIDEEADPLVWWKAQVQAKQYRFLPTLAKKYLCVCATSSPSERLFSIAGQVVTPSRSLLKPDRVNQLTFLAKNL